MDFTKFYESYRVEFGIVATFDKRAASLASSSESEDGGVWSPPRKKQRLVAAANMQTNGNGCPQHNGETGESHLAAASTSQMNGACSVLNGDLEHTDHNDSDTVKYMSDSDKDIVRLIGQHLRCLGLK